MADAPPNVTQELAAGIERYIRPDTFPVAFKMAHDEAEVPAKARRPLRDMGTRFSLCQGWNLARRYGWTVAMGREDMACPIGAIVAGFQPAVPHYEEGHLCAGMYTESLEAGRRSEEGVSRFARGTYQYMVVGPLSRAAYDPDVVLVYGNSAQVMTLAAAALYRRGGRLTMQASPRVDCAEIVVDTMRTQECQVVLPCYGDRVFGQTQDHEMAFTIPPSRFGEVLEGLAGTYKGGVRYPIPQFMAYEVKVPPSYAKLFDIWQETSDE
ncbi:MAG: DUF169 domain-containing protein [Chloroflexi bacterium]|nr:DUF169 domain-containing protein [Chloroflexota bacterium]